MTMRSPPTPGDASRWWVGRAREVEALGTAGARWLRLTKYLAGLPQGLESHPGCTARRGLVEMVMSAAPRPAGPEPALVTELLTPPTTPWIPEAVFGAGILAMADRAGWTEAELLAWHRSLNRHLFRGPIYRALMAFFSPMLLLQRGANRWATFHAGSTLTVDEDGPRGAVARLSFPARLFTELLLRVYAEAFAAALENARAGQVMVELSQVGETSAAFRARW
jgi:hypothetical protein